MLYAPSDGRSATCFYMQARSSSGVRAGDGVVRTAETSPAQLRGKGRVAHALPLRRAALRGMLREITPRSTAPSSPDR